MTTTETSEPILRVARDGAVAVVTLNRPETLNALNPALMRALPEALQTLAGDASVRCVVLTGAGKGFCAGGDVREINKAADARVAGMPAAAQERTARPALSTEQRAAWLRRSAEASRLLHEMPKPTIAMINGACAGAGLSLAAACDMRFAATSAVFRPSFTPHGMSGDYGGSWFWTHILGTAKARRLYFIDEKRDADAALAFGLVDEVFADDELAEVVLARARLLARLPGAGLAYAKANLNAALTEPLAAALDRESLAMMQAREAMVAVRRAERGQ